VHWVIDGRSSLAWWQINPHLGDLWGTSCPQESTWHAGRGPEAFKHPKTGYAGVIDTVVPLYPRPVAQAVCGPAVQGELWASDTVTWQQVHGSVAVSVNALVSGTPIRDGYTHRTLFESGSFPSIQFELDSVTGVRRSGDTLSATGVGVFELRGVRQPMTVSIRAWHEALGLRITGQGEFPALDLITKYRMSRMALGLGVSEHIWKRVHWGLDAILLPAGHGAT
jgi:hypothetical protein